MTKSQYLQESLETVFFTLLVIMKHQDTGKIETELEKA